jgi:hypothetical protein
VTIPVAEAGQSRLECRDPPVPGNDAAVIVTLLAELYLLLTAKHLQLTVTPRFVAVLTLQATSALGLSGVTDRISRTRHPGSVGRSHY